jgi:hypothetical protein
MLNHYAGDSRVECLRAALASAPQVPQGWKLVPVEPTWDMQMAASSNYREPRDGHYTARMECAADAYRAMLAAAPQPGNKKSL